MLLIYMYKNKIVISNSLIAVSLLVNKINNISIAIRIAIFIKKIKFMIISQILYIILDKYRIIKIIMLNLKKCKHNIFIFLNC
jgi:hypothetical protein